MCQKIFDFSKLIGEIDILIFCNTTPVRSSLCFLHGGELALF